MDGVVRAANDELHTKIMQGRSVAATAAGRRMSRVSKGSSLDTRADTIGDDGYITAGGTYVNMVWSATKEAQRADAVRTMRAEQARRTAMRWLNQIKKYATAAVTTGGRAADDDTRALPAPRTGASDGQSGEGGGKGEGTEGGTAAQRALARSKSGALRAMFQRGVSKARQLVHKQGTATC